MVVKAVYRIKKFNPFFPGMIPPIGSFISKTAQEVPDEMEEVDLIEYAKSTIPDGYDYAWIEINGQKVKKESNEI